MSSNSGRKVVVPKYFIPTPNEPNSPPKLSPVKLIVGIIFSVIGLLSIASIYTGLFIPIISFIPYYVGYGSFFYWLIIGFILLAGAIMLKGWYTAKKESQRLYQQKMSDYRDAYDVAEPKPSDVQMDKWLSEDIEEIKRDAFEKLDLNDEDIIHDPNDPIIVIGPTNKAKFGIGKDLIIRFSAYDVLLIYLTEYHLAAYKCTLDFATKIRTYESTQEYHYTDVVSVSTKTGSDLAFTYNGETKSLANYQQFALSVASGESINVATPVSFAEQLSGAAGIIENGKLPDSGADKAIRVIRSRLREKKGGAVS